MKTLIKTALLLILALPLLSHAGDGSGKINSIIAHSEDVVMFDVTEHNNPPPCSSHAWAVNISTPTGKAMYAALLAAAAQGKDVAVSGANDCAAWGDRERPYYIVVYY